MERRLSAILAADMVGYSRLMEADEIGTIERQKAHRRELINPAFEQYHGRVVKEMGDGILVEFPSVVDAVSCAIVIQRAMPERETEIDEDRRIAYRVGINLGDVVVEGDDLFGDGVNVAARLEHLSEPGGVCISGTVYDHIQSRVEFDCNFLGEQELKNISRPVRAYQVTATPEFRADVSENLMRTEPASLSLPDKPSIAVLPFHNMSGDPEQEYFSDGMTEDIIAALSRLRWLFVIARNSTFTYKGQAVDVKKVGREMGVRYVLEGSVRKAGNRVRVSAQLIEAENGNYIWAERYDRDLDDIFELQDEITATIIGNIEPELGGAELNRSKRKPVNNLNAWDSYLRARWHVNKGQSTEILGECIRLCHRAIAASPTLACAHAELAFLHIAEVAFGFSGNREKSIQLAYDGARAAVKLDRKDATAHSVLGRVYDFRGQFEDAVREHKIALGLNPNSCAVHLYLASTYNHAGEPELVIPAVDQAQRLSPRDTSQWFMHMNKGFALSQLERHDEAIEELKAACHCSNDNYWSQLGLAVVLAQAGELQDASASLSAAMEYKTAFKRISDITQAFETASGRYRGFLVTGCEKAGMED